MCTQDFQVSAYIHWGLATDKEEGASRSAKRRKHPYAVAPADCSSAVVVQRKATHATRKQCQNTSSVEERRFGLQGWPLSIPVLQRQHGRTNLNTPWAFHTNVFDMRMSVARGGNNPTAYAMGIPPRPRWVKSFRVLRDVLG